MTVGGEVPDVGAGSTWDESTRLYTSGTTGMPKGVPLPSAAGVLTAAECDKHCLAHPMLANYKRPRGYKFVSSLPRTATGKLMHYKIREEVRAGSGIADFGKP
jgi:acyl-coenzyme A synthetase/AMP-(fatty) acid ligase